MAIDLIFYLLLLLAISLYGIVNYTKFTIPFRALALTVFCICLSEIAARILARTIHNSSPTYHILCIFLYAGFTFTYSQLLTGARLKNALLLSIIPFTALCIVNMILFQSFFSFPSNTIVISYLLFVLYSLILFMQMLNSPKEVNIFKQGIFWFNIAMLVYSILTPLCFGVSDYLHIHKLYATLLNNFIEYFCFVYYATLGYALYLDKNRHQMTLAPAKS